MPRPSSQQISTPVPKERLFALDYLRGFFIAVIAIDHLWKFPSLWMFFTGQAKLWMTAAEGFVMISGFLIGYVRGYKGLKHPFSFIAKKLVSRSFILYVWMFVMTFLFAWIAWHASIVPDIPSPPVSKDDWWSLFAGASVVRDQAIWIFFLGYYAVFLLLAIPFVWLLRRRWPLVAAAMSIIGYWYGIVADVEWMRWQIIFFAATLAGYYYHSIHEMWYQLHESRRQQLKWVLYGTSIITLALSIACTFVPSIAATPWAQALNKTFDNEIFGPGRVIIAMLWFLALTMFFNDHEKTLRTPKFEILHFFGTRSLTSYICQGLIIITINTLLQPFTYTGDNFIINTLLGAIMVVGTYWFMRIPLVARIVPR